MLGYVCCNVAYYLSSFLLTKKQKVNEVGLSLCYTASFQSGIYFMLLS